MGGKHTVTEEASIILEEESNFADRPANSTHFVRDSGTVGVIFTTKYLSLAHHCILTSATCSPILMITPAFLWSSFVKLEIYGKD